MADRTSYYELNFNQGELKQIEGQTEQEGGITEADLLHAEANAMRRINQFILRVSGPLQGASTVATFKDDSNPLDPIIAHLAELIAAADILEQYERFNHADEGDAGQTKRTDANEVRGRATKIAQDIVDAGGTLTSTGSFRRWFYPKGQQGIRVSGPNASGSRFDHRGYKNHRGEHLPGPVDPYDEAKRIAPPYPQGY